MWDSNPTKGSTKRQHEDATTSFLNALNNTREVRKPIEVEEVNKKVLPHTADEYEITYSPDTDANHPYERWRSHFILRYIASREIARFLDRKTFITVSFREAIIYTIFLILIIVISLAALPLDMFYFSQAMTTLYTRQKFFSKAHVSEITFYDINTMSDVFDYIENLQDKLKNDFWYAKPYAYESVEPEDKRYFENKLIGCAQIRQVRAQNGSCQIHDKIKHLYWADTCYGSYSLSNVGTDKILTKNSQNSGEKEFFYTNASDTNSLPITGSIATYGGGGYIGLFCPKGVDSIQVVYKLRSSVWMDRGTRAVFVEFTIYNGNVNVFCIFKLIFEIPSTGGVVPSHSNYVQKLIRYSDSYDYFVLGCEILFAILFVFFTVQKVLEIITLRLKLLPSFWNWVDIILLVMCYLVTIFDIMLYDSVNKELPTLLKADVENKYPSFDHLSLIYKLFSHSFAILIVFAFFRLLKYFNIIRTMYQLQSTIARAVPFILSYCVIFFYIYFIFALIAVYLFGSKLEDYKTFFLSVFALLRSLVGDFHYLKIVQAEPIYGPMFFFAFVYTITFVLVNVFLAILVTQYDEVRREVRIGGAKTFIGDMLKLWFLRVLEKADCNWLLSQIERKRFEKKIRSPSEAVRQYLVQAGYSELEIELFFKKYDITDSKITAMDEERISFKQKEREAPPPLTQKDILRYIVIQKMDYLETHYEAANRLIDEFLAKLIKLETKHHR